MLGAFLFVFQSPVATKALWCTDSFAANAFWLAAVASVAAAVTGSAFGA